MLPLLNSHCATMCRWFFATASVVVRTESLHDESLNISADSEKNISCIVSDVLIRWGNVVLKENSARRMWRPTLTSIQIDVGKKYVIQWQVDLISITFLEDVLEKDNFTEVFTNLAQLYRSEDNSVGLSNNCVGHLNWLLQCQNVLQHCSTCFLST